MRQESNFHLSHAELYGDEIDLVLRKQSKMSSPTCQERDDLLLDDDPEEEHPTSCMDQLFTPTNKDSGMLVYQVTLDPNTELENAFESSFVDKQPNLMHEWSTSTQNLSIGEESIKASQSCAQKSFKHGFADKSVMYANEKHSQIVKFQESPVEPH